MSARPSVAVVGLGLMGRPMAIALRSAGFAVCGWNRSPLDAELVGGIPVCAELAQAAAADVLLLVLADSAAVGDVLAGLALYLRPGHLVLDMGSSDPDDSRARAERLAGRGVGWVDAPVSGGPEGAASGTLAIMVGGRAEDVSCARPLLEALGRNVVHLGGPGAGHAMKVVNQLIVGITIETVAEALALAEKAGFEVAAVQQALAGGSADSRVLRVQGTRMGSRDFTPGAKVTTMLKDLRMAEKLAGSAGLELPLLRTAIALYERLVEAGDGGLDCSVLYELRVG